METRKFDVVVVGAGSAGAAVALNLARAGRSVAVLEARSLDRAGARWVNGVAPWMFERAGVELPQPPERRVGARRFVMLDPEGRRRVVVDPGPLLSVDMRLLVGRLQGAAAAAGAKLFGAVKLGDLVFEKERPAYLEAHVSGRAVHFAADLFVDASGLGGALRRRVPQLGIAHQRAARSDLCSAAQQVRLIRDSGEAMRFLERVGGLPGDSLAFMSIDGGYSTLAVQIDPEAGVVDLLTGAVADPGRRSGAAILRDFVAVQRWIGEPLFGGSGAIPLRRPLDEFTAQGIALVGDSACQVFPAHGSGVGTGLVAAKMLAAAIADRDDPGEASSLFGYQSAFMREIGAVSGAYDVFRRLSQSLTGAEVGQMIASGLMAPAMSAAGLEQRLPAIGLSAGLSAALGVAREPALARKLAPAVARMQAVAALYRRYPGSRDGLARWRRLAERLIGGAPAQPAVGVDPRMRRAA